MKKVIALLLAIIILIPLVACESTGDKPKLTENEKQQNQEQNVEKAQNDNSMEIAAEAIKMILDKNFGGSGIDYSLAYEGSALAISVKADGIAEEVSKAIALGYDDTYEPWVTMRESMVSLCSSIYDALGSFGVEDGSVVVSVMNDANMDNILLSIFNGVVVYDAMAK